MNKTTPKPFHERAREAAFEFALRVAIDPTSTPEDVEAAKRVVAQPDLGQALEGVEPWKLAAVRSLLADDEHTPAIRALYVRHETLDQDPE